jgi:hypothetical protein
MTHRETSSAQKYCAINIKRSTKKYAAQANKAIQGKRKKACLSLFGLGKIVRMYSKNSNGW